MKVRNYYYGVYKYYEVSVTCTHVHISKHHITALRYDLNASAYGLVSLSSPSSDCLYACTRISCSYWNSCGLHVHLTSTNAEVRCEASETATSYRLNMLFAVTTNFNTAHLRTLISVM